MIMAWVPQDRWGRHKSTRGCVCVKSFECVCAAWQTVLHVCSHQRSYFFYTLWSCCCTCPSAVLVLIELALTHSHIQTHTYTPKLWSINNTVTGLYSLTSTDAVCRKVQCSMKVLISVVSLFSRCAVLAPVRRITSAHILPGQHQQQMTAFFWICHLRRGWRSRGNNSPENPASKNNKHSCRFLSHSIWVGEKKRQYANIITTGHLTAKTVMRKRKM